MDKEDDWESPPPPPPLPVLAVLPTLAGDGKGEKPPPGKGDLDCRREKQTVGHTH